MGRRRKGRFPGSSSEASSRHTTPAVSESEESSENEQPVGKKQKSVNSPVQQEQAEKKKGPKSSDEICRQFNLKDVCLEYSDADYLNLTNYGLFVRMVRPQVQEANPKISSTKMATLMEAKWREFRESNPFTKKRREEEERRKREEEEEKKRQERKKLEEEQERERKLEEKRRKEKEAERKKEEEARKKKESTPEDEEEEDEDDTEVDNEEDENEEEDEEEEEEEEDEYAALKKKAKRSAATLKIRLPITMKFTPLRKSGRDRKSTKPHTPQSDRDFEKMLRTDSEDDSGHSSRSRRSAKKSKKKAEVVFLQSESEPDDSDFVMRSRKTPKRQAAKKRSRQEDEDENEDLSDDEKTKKSAAKKAKKAAESDDDDYGNVSEEEEEEDEDESESESEVEVKKKKRRPVIPGERKSERQKKKGKSPQQSDNMTDREFEKLLRAAPKDKEVKRIKAKAKVAKNEGRKLNRKSGRLPVKEKKEGDEEGGESGNESDHSWFCEICKDGGDLLLCDTCPKSWHMKCLKITEVPDGKWSCPKCTGEMEESEDEESDTEHDQWCKVCKDGGDVVLCDFCPFVYHPNCLVPPLKDIPEEKWKCPRCHVGEMTLKGKVKRVLTWRWTHQPSADVVDELDHTHSPQKKKMLKEQEEKDEREAEKEKRPQREKRPDRELFVRYMNFSYWDCEWIPELALEIFQPMLWKMFQVKFDMDEPPALEDGSSFGRIRHRSTKEEDPHDLETRFYRFGIKPEWLEIHRIFNHESYTKGRKNFLVKWRDVQYEDATWEDPREIPEELEDEFHKHVAKYYKRRNEHLSEKENKKERPKRKDLLKKLEKQPKYIGISGGNLHPYQLEGLNWLRFSWAQQTNTILADEMGLGKTIQAIAILYTLWKEGYTKGPFLVTAPLSTVPNWEREFAFWAPELYVLTYCGGKENRIVMREHEFSYKEGAFKGYHTPMRMRPSHKPKFDVLLTSYEYISMDFAILQSLSWSTIVIDEAHRLKNNQSLFFTMLCKYDIGYKLLMTGTPLQNNLEELFNLMNFMEPEKFSDMEEFLDEFAEISKDEQVRKLHEMLAPHMLRRLKADVLKEIPSKTELIVRIELSDMQKKYYKHILTKNYEALNVKGHSSVALLNIMMDLRKCCNHPYLFPTAEQNAPITNKGYFEGKAMTEACGKLLLMSKMLPKLKEQGHRVLIFSQMTRLLDILEDFLVYMELKYERIDGNITGHLRQESIDRFNSPDSDSWVFLLSTKAGGLGINLATADTVIIYDMDWNPHNDIQAFSRAHRIGQVNKVMIYRFVSRHTVEEKMTQVAKKKMMLTELVIHRGMGKIVTEKTESLSKQEVNEILKFGAENLFKDEEGAVVYDDTAVDRLLDRSQSSEGDQEVAAEKEFGLNEYLRSFRVASYNVKEGEIKEDVVVQEEPSIDREKDREYWKRILGSSYEEHQLQLLREQEELLRSLGKGKRLRKQINYAEALMDKKLRQNLHEARESPKESEKEDEEDNMDDEEEAKSPRYMSDYEPESSESGEESEEEEEQESAKEEPVEKKRGRPPLNKKAVSTELPPLLAKVNGHTEVLGFTARQRRAFLDAVMRFGLPPEEVYKSQWLVRDLRRKAEKIFKAYVSLFMRHLCEPIAEGAEKFADGVPREGLSRQHVLTRIGMMALIRRKVQEFEGVNGEDSLRSFNLLSPFAMASENGQPTARATSSGTSSPSPKTSTPAGPSPTPGMAQNGAKPDADDEASKADGKDAEKKALTDAKTESAGEAKKDSATDTQQKTEEEKELKTEDTAAKGDKESKQKDEEKTQNKDEEKDKKSSTEEEESERKDAEEKKEKEVAMETTSAENDVKTEEKTPEEEDVKKESKGEEPSRSTGEKVEGEEEEKDAKTTVTVNEETGEREKEQPMEVDGKEESPTKEKEKPVEVDGKEESTTKEKEQSMEVDGKEESTTKEKVKEVDGKEESTTKEKKSEDTKPDKNAESEAGEKESQKEEEDKAKAEEKEGEDGDSGKQGKDDTKSREADAKENKKEEKSDKSPKGASEKDTAAEKKDKDLSKEEKTMVNGEQEKVAGSKETKEEKTAKQAELQRKPLYPTEPAKRARELRCKFYIADGGFTELHALWQYEEQFVKPIQEHRTWHRRHDLWLLAGIVTHGYRHWQDILNDPRFDLLNRAFHSDADRMRKGAFLNRRFQLLEQSMVVEEQMRKELRSNPKLSGMLPPLQLGQIEDSFTEVDRLASVIRKVFKTGAYPKDVELEKLVSSIEGLVGDIRQAAYTTMPATLARPTTNQPAAVRPPQQQVNRPPPPRTKQPQKPGNTNVICID